MQHFYFDHNATTPVAPEVLAAATGAMAEVYGNASSIHHFGQVAKQRLETARRQVAALLNADAREIVFTSGGTESDNLALRGVARSGHVITSAIEHPAVLNTCAQLEREGLTVTYTAPGRNGIVQPEAVRDALRPDTVLVSIMHANNELGTVQPIAEVAAITRRAGVCLHTDGVQAAGRIPTDVRALGVDLYSISGHKLYAPKGIGALYVRKGVALRAIAYGGHHERERRPGTENVPGAVAFGCAAELARLRLAAEAAWLSALRDRLESSILQRVPGAHVNAGGAPRTPNTTNICFDGVEGEAMVIALDLRGFAVSTGAACSSGAIEPSHVLTAIGLNAEEARGSLRFSLGHCNDAEQVDALADAVAASAAHLRKLSPAWQVQHV